MVHLPLFVFNYPPTAGLGHFPTVILKFGCIQNPILSYYIVGKIRGQKESVRINSTDKSRQIVSRWPTVSDMILKCAAYDGNFAIHKSPPVDSWDVVKRHS